MSEMLGDANSTSEYEDLMDSDENISENQQNGENWSELPSLSIEKIYSFLSRTDQCKMSLVCQRWANEYGSPILWKTVKFYLPEHHYSSEIYPEVRFARKYGSMFRHVEIICKTVRPHLLDVISKQLKFFVQALTSKSQLMSIKLINMGGYFSELDDFKHQDVFRVIVNFFKSQKNLRVIDFRNSLFWREEGVELLEVLSEACSNTLREISLRGFFSYWEDRELKNESIADLSDIFNLFLNVQTIEIDYTWVFEDMMRLCEEDYGPNTPAFLYAGNQKRCLSTLNIYYLGFEKSDFRGIPPSCWKTLNKICPSLTVNLNLNLALLTRDEIERFIVRFMPIKTLNLFFHDLYTSSRIDISVLFNHIQNCWANDHLEVVKTVWRSPISDVAAVVVPFLRACSKLQTFDLFANHSNNNGIENILKSLLEQRPSCLKSMILSFDNVMNKEDEANLAALLEAYRPLLQVIGIELFLCDNLVISLRRRGCTT